MPYVDITVDASPHADESGHRTSSVRSSMFT